MSVFESWLGFGLGDRNAKAEIYNAGATGHIYQVHVLHSTHPVVTEHITSPLKMHQSTII
jgi:hypothetical protein